MLMRVCELRAASARKRWEYAFTRKEMLNHLVCGFSLSYHIPPPRFGHWIIIDMSPVNVWHFVYSFLYVIFFQKESGKNQSKKEESVEFSFAIQKRNRRDLSSYWRRSTFCSVLSLCHFIFFFFFFLSFVHCWTILLNHFMTALL